MKLSDFDYNLPKNLIAQKPVFLRDTSRLLVLDRKTGEILHRRFFEIEKFMHAGDVLVLNNAKVFPARLLGKKETGGKAEILFLKEIESGVWEIMLKTSNPKIGAKILFNNQMSDDSYGRRKRETLDLIGEIIKNNNGIFEIKFNKSGAGFWKIVNKIGYAPLPSYIKENQKPNTKNQNLFRAESRNYQSKMKKLYQTVFAKYTGSVAAPTAGFHFTPQLLACLKKKGIQIEYITLHIGIGTFLSVKTENIKEHKMHTEFAEISKAAASRLNEAKKQGRKIVACGTTVCRSLEAASQKLTYDLRQTTNDMSQIYQLTPLKKEINLFIYPGYKFKFIDALITNFHLSKTTLLMLVCAFAGREIILKAYHAAIRGKYRFYSFGDAMLIK